MQTYLTKNIVPLNRPLRGLGRYLLPVLSLESSKDGDFGAENLPMHGTLFPRLRSLTFEIKYLKLSFRGYFTLNY